MLESVVLDLARRRHDAPHTEVTKGRSQADKHRSNRKYQWMESNMQRKSAGLQDKIPDIQKTLDTVRFLKTRTVRFGPRLASGRTPENEKTQPLTAH